MQDKEYFKVLIHLLSYLRENSKYSIKFYKNNKESSIHKLRVPYDEIGARF